MYLKRLILTNFKNINSVDIELCEKINCFTGNNGAGKTNLLDAVYYLSYCKSFYNLIDNQNINHNSDFFAIHGQYNRGVENEDTVSCIQKKNSKKIFKYNKKDYDRLADHIGKIPLIMISPYDIDLINDGSEVRRKYLDSVISQFDKIYLDDLINYNRALQQRNSLLKTIANTNKFSLSSIEIWDKQLIKFGESIFEKRKDFLFNFLPLFQKYYLYISKDKEKVEINYLSQLNDNDLEDLLLSSFERDRYLQYTSVGVHKDDLEFHINGFHVKKFGSQGQQKSFLIALKLAQFEFTKNIKGYKPILLLDDIFDKLDNNRVEQLVELVAKENFKQVFITDTQTDRIKEIFEKMDIFHQFFSVQNGNIIKL